MDLSDLEIIINRQKAQSLHFARLAASLGVRFTTLTDETGDITCEQLYSNLLHEYPIQIENPIDQPASFTPSDDWIAAIPYKIGDSGYVAYKTIHQSRQRNPMNHRFISAPKSNTETCWADYVNNSTSQPGSATITSSNLLGLITSCSPSDNIISADVTIRRCCTEDSICSAIFPEYQEDGPQKDDISGSVKGLYGKIHTRLTNSNWTVYNRFDITVILAKSEDKDAMENALRQNPRGVYLDHDIGGPSALNCAKGAHEIRNKMKNIGILDGECLLSLYTSWMPCKNVIRIAGYVPSNSGTALNACDWMLASIGRSGNMNAARAYINEHTQWRGKDLATLKKEAERAFSNVVEYNEQQEDYLQSIQLALPAFGLYKK